MNRSVAKTHAVLVLVLLTALVSWARPVVATPKSFARADAAWHEGMLEKSQKLYRQALQEGGLEPREVVVAYSRIGTVKAALRDERGALSDFRVAAAIDPEFELPADSGPIAEELYERARNEAASQGEALEIALDVPALVPRLEPFTVETSIPEGFAVLVAEVVVTVEDPVTGKKWRRRKPAGAHATFSFPERVAIEGARLQVRAGAVDSYDNEWAVAVSEIKVEGERHTRTLESGNVDPFAEEVVEDEGEEKKKLFERPVPWIVAGGVLLLGGVVTAIAVRPRKVEVGSPSWQ